LFGSKRVKDLMVAVSMVSKGLLQVDDFLHSELDISMDTVKKLKEILKLFLARGQMTNVLSAYLYQCASFLAAKLMACCSKDSM
jgi:archaellum component FlaC